MPIWNAAPIAEELTITPLGGRARESTPEFGHDSPSYAHASSKWRRAPWFIATRGTPTAGRASFRSAP